MTKQKLEAGRNWYAGFIPISGYEDAVARRQSEHRELKLLEWKIRFLTLLFPPKKK